MLRRTVVVAALLAAVPARAGGPEAAAAEQAFDKGRDLMKAGLYSEACAAFDESERLDPQIGTLYNLASCWEKVGKLASAWTAYREVAQRDSNATRRKAADEHARALAPRLPKLVITVDAPPPGTTVTLNGGDVTKLIGIETPMDLGTYAVVVSAKGYQPWGGEAKIDREGAKVTIAVPKLLVVGARPVSPPVVAVEKKPPPPVVTIEKKPPPPAVTIEKQPPPPAAPPAPGNRHARLALVTGIGGGALVAGGLVAGWLARGKLDDALALCPDRTCAANPQDLPAANADLAASRTRGNLSTALVAVGAGALVATGVLWWTGRDAEQPPRAAVAPVITPSSAALVVTGRF